MKNSGCLVKSSSRPSISYLVRVSFKISYTTCLTGIEEKDYATYYTAKAYVTYTFGDKEYVAYSAPFRSSIYEVAQFALDNDNRLDNATKAYGFITYLGTGTVYDKDNNAVCEIPIDELEFVVFSGLDAVITGYYYRVETEFGTLWFDSSNDVFYLRFNEVEDDYREYREYYQLIGKNLDELIAEYSVIEE